MFAQLLRPIAVTVLLVASAAAQSSPRTRLVLVGDSTSTGSSLQTVFDPAHLVLTASSSGDRSIRTFVESGAWAALLARLHPGDFVVLDFLDTPLNGSPAVRVLSGTGDRSEDYTDPATGKTGLVHTFGWYLRLMVVDSINQGATPILCAPAATINPQPSPAGDLGLTVPNSTPASIAQPHANAHHAANALTRADDPSPETTANWTAAIAAEQRIPLIRLDSPTLTAAALRAGLQALNPDPLAPYLAKSPPPD